MRREGGTESSRQTTLPPLRTTRAISRKPSSKLARLRSPKAMVAASKDPSSTGRARALPSTNSTPARSPIARLASLSISGDRSTPTTLPSGPTARLRAAVSLPVPQATSSARPPRASRAALTAARRHRSSRPPVIRVLIRSYTGAIESNIPVTRASGTELPARAVPWRWVTRRRRPSPPGSRRRAASRRRKMVVRQAQWPALEGARKDHLCLGRENLRHQLNHVQHALEMARICRANLQQVVGLTGQVMAFLDLVDADEVTGHVGCDGARDLLDEDKSQNTIAKHRRVNHGRVAADHASGFELLDPLMGGRTAHPDGLAHLGVRLTPIALQQLKNPSVRLIDAFERAHFLNVLERWQRHAPGAPGDQPIRSRKKPQRGPLPAAAKVMAMVLESVGRRTRPDGRFQPSARRRTSRLARSTGLMSDPTPCRQRHWAHRRGSRLLTPGLRSVALPARAIGPGVSRG